jgi:hypothetical protein
MMENTKKRAIVNFDEMEIDVVIDELSTAQ